MPRHVVESDMVFTDGYMEFDGYVLIKSTDDPPEAYPDAGYLYSKEVDGYSELHYMDDYGMASQITTKGSAGGGAADTVSNIIASELFT